MIADHLGGTNTKADAATPEDSSGVRQKGDAMSEIKRFTSGDSGYMLWDKKGDWVRYEHHLAEVERLKAMLPPTAHTGVRNGPGEGSWSVFAGKVMEERDAAQAEVKRLTQELAGCRAANHCAMDERNAALNEVERLRTNGQGMLDSSRPTDEDIWREAFITMLPSFPWEKAAEKSDCVLVEYRKRWPR